MKNDKGKLEISKWLQEKGLRSKIYAKWEYSCRDHDYYSYHEVGYELDDDEFGETGRLPWFNLDKVQELLPKRLGDHWFLRSAPGMAIFYKDYSTYLNVPELHQMSYEIGDHLAALKLLKKVIETHGIEVINV
ncbi:MAG: hypothetical protein HRT47_01630 [Candidatus Caenarcaniphilales bacterium]|nr:hypothetical protein [Candidatus Caenarcaniphilales bacterium]